MVRAANTAAPYVAAPLAAGDARVAAVLDELERRVPLVAEPPKVIVETTRQAVMSRISPHVNKVGFLLLFFAIYSFEKEIGEEIVFCSSSYEVNLHEIGCRG